MEDAMCICEEVGHITNNVCDVWGIILLLEIKMKNIFFFILENKEQLLW